MRTVYDIMYAMYSITGKHIYAYCDLYAWGMPGQAPLGTSSLY